MVGRQGPSGARPTAGELLQAFPVCPQPPKGGPQPGNATLQPANVTLQLADVTLQRADATLQTLNATSQMPDVTGVRDGGSGFTRPFAFATAYTVR